MISRNWLIEIATFVVVWIINEFSCRFEIYIKSAILPPPMTCMKLRLSCPYSTSPSRRALIISKVAVMVSDKVFLLFLWHLWQSGWHGFLSNIPEPIHLPSRTTYSRYSVSDLSLPCASEGNNVLQENLWRRVVCV